MSTTLRVHAASSSSHACHSQYCRHDKDTPLHHKTAHKSVAEKQTSYLNHQAIQSTSPSLLTTPTAPALPSCHGQSRQNHFSYTRGTAGQHISLEIYISLLVRICMKSESLPAVLQILLQPPTCKPLPIETIWSKCLNIRSTPLPPCSLQLHDAAMLQPPARRMMKSMQSLQSPIRHVRSASSEPAM